MVSGTKSLEIFQSIHASVTYGDNVVNLNPPGIGADLAIGCCVRASSLISEMNLMPELSWNGLPDKGNGRLLSLLNSARVGRYRPVPS